jgi:hypothetical protein
MNGSTYLGKINVFISASSDLERERETVRSAVQDLYFAHVIGLEAGAWPEMAFKGRVSRVRDADLYIGVFWQQYGDVTGRGISTVEEEYQEARAHKKPMLIYIKEPAERELLLTRFLRDVRDAVPSCLIDTFSTCDELAVRVQQGIMGLLSGRLQRDAASEEPGPSQSIRVSVTGSPGANVNTAGRDLYQGGYSVGPALDEFSSIDPEVDRERLTSLRQQLIAGFNEEELRTLCFDLGVDYDGLPARGKGGKARELVQYLSKRDRVADLEVALRQLR